MEEELKRLRDAIAKRNDSRDTIVDIHIREMVGEPRDFLIFNLPSAVSHCSLTPQWPNKFPQRPRRGGVDGLAFSNAARARPIDNLTHRPIPQ